MDKGDPWIVGNSPIEPEKLHAMGVITFHWNVCEFYLRLLCSAVTGRPFVDVWAETANQRPSAIYAKLKLAIDRSSDTDATKEALRYAIELYDRNRENRAQISHFIPEGGGTSHIHNSRSTDFMAIFQQTPIRSSIDDLRCVAEQIRVCRAYIIDLVNALAREPFDAIQGKAGPLPDKPPLPSRIWSSPFPRSAQSPPPQGQPSR